MLIQETLDHLLISGVSSSSEKAVLKNLGAKRKSPTEYQLPGIHASYYQLCRAFGKTIPWIPLNEEIPEIPEIPLSERQVWDQLYSFQQSAVQFLLETHHRGSMICLSPGLGKTAVSIVTARILGLRKILVIAPLTLLRTWEREIKVWGGEDALLLHGVSDQDYFPKSWVVANYDTISRNVEIFDREWDVIILDESILVKTRTSLRTQAVKKISAKSGRVWMLSGSPTSRYLDDLFAQFQILLPKMFTSYWRFAETYCYILRDQWGWTVNGSRQDIDTQKEFEDIMFVRSMNDVIDLPEELHETIYLDLSSSQRRVYQELLKNFTTQLASGDYMSVPNRMAQLLRLQEVVSGLKTFDLQAEDASTKFDAIEEFLETGRAEPPVLIWTHWVQTGKTLLERLQKKYHVALITSETPPVERQSVIDGFQSGEVQILVMSLGTGKYGLTLTRANSIIYCDRSWDADALFQSSFRVRRIGLDHSPVVITLLCPGTTDDLVTSNLYGKLQDIARLTSTDLLALLDQIGGSE